jgi:hypothetical protein
MEAAGIGDNQQDILGYGGTSKSEARGEYAFAKVSAHIAKLLDSEALTKVIGVGHNWCGTFLLSALLPCV